MIAKFLKAKHWQIFVLMFGIPFIFQIIMMSTIFSNITPGLNSFPHEIISLMKFLPIIIILSIVIFFGWFWSISIGLQKKLPEHIKMKTSKFKLFFFIPLIYISCFSFFMSSFFMSSFMTDGLSPVGMETNYNVLNGMIGVIVPLHLLSMFGIFYSMYFTAKTLKTVELQREVVFNDFAGEFFLLWFNFVGVWILQPRINKLVEDDNAIANPEYY